MWGRARHFRTKSKWQRYDFGRRYGKVERHDFNMSVWRKRRPLLIFLACLAGLIFLLSIFNWPIFKVHQYEIKGLQDIAATDLNAQIDQYLDASTGLIFQKNDFFLLPVGELEKYLQDNFHLQNIKIKKVWPNKLKIDLQERVSAFSYLIYGSYYQMDINGLKIKRIEAPDPKLLLIDDQRSNVDPNQVGLDKNVLDQLNVVLSNWSRSIDGKAPINKIIVYNDNYAEIYTQAGYFVKIDLGSSIEEQIASLNSYLSSGAAQGKQHNYIDIRFGDKLFFK